MNLKNISKSKTFYEDRYSKGYMEEWPMEKKLRVSKIINGLQLPEYGEALDFGCGNGVFMNVIQQVLPKWTIYGCDISKIAIKNASKRFSNYHFFENSDRRYLDKKFDFVFTHHVLEHVFDIEQIVKQIASRTKNISSMLHILPCGNPGSFEYKLCTLRNNGINHKMENRFYFEDEGHVRRLSTAQCSTLYKRYHFFLKRDLYSNHYFGSMDWITRSPTALIFTIFDPIHGKNISSKIILMFLLTNFLIIQVLRKIAINFDRILRANNKKMKHFIFISIFWLPAILIILFEKYVQFLVNNEWSKCKKHENGSEMYLYYTKTK